MTLRLLTYTFGKMALYGVFSMALVALFVVVIVMRTDEQNSTPLTQSRSVPLPSTLTTETWGVFDPETGEIIAGNNLEERRPIASVTKLFTAETVLTSEKKDDVFYISSADIRTEGRAGKLVYGEKVTPYELLFPLLIESSNDAAIAIKRGLGEDFGDSLAEVTKSLALTHTDIREPSGLSPENVSTVQDLSIFYTYLRRVHPHILDITQLNTYVGPYTGYINNNPGHTLATFTGGKHGYTEEADHTFIGTFTRAHADTEIGVVVLQSEDLLQDIQAILAYSESL